MHFRRSEPVSSIAQEGKRLPQQPQPQLSYAATIHAHPGITDQERLPIFQSAAQDSSAAIHTDSGTTHQKQVSKQSAAQGSSQPKDTAMRNLFSRQKASQKALNRPAFIRIDDSNPRGLVKAAQGRAQTAAPAAAASTAKSASPAAALVAPHTSQISFAPATAAAADSSLTLAAAAAAAPLADASKALAPATAELAIAKPQDASALAPPPAEDPPHLALGATRRPGNDSQAAHTAFVQTGRDGSAAADAASALPEATRRTSAVSQAAHTALVPASRDEPAAAISSSVPTEARGPLNAGKSPALTASVQVVRDQPADADAASLLTEARRLADNSAAHTAAMQTGRDGSPAAPHIPSVEASKDDAASAAHPLLLQTSKRRKKSHKGVKPQSSAPSGPSSWQELLDQSQSADKTSASDAQQELFTGQCGIFALHQAAPNLMSQNGM